MRTRLFVTSVALAVIAGAVWAVAGRFSEEAIPAGLPVAVAADSCCATGECCCPGKGECCDPALRSVVKAAPRGGTCCALGDCCCLGKGSCCDTEVKARRTRSVRVAPEMLPPNDP